MMSDETSHQYYHSTLGQQGTRGILCSYACGDKADVLAAGFKLDAESSILANPSDDHTKGVFDPSVRGHTDQFLFRFKKPK